MSTGAVKLSDFGIAELVGHDCRSPSTRATFPSADVISPTVVKRQQSRTSSTGMIAGSLQWMSAEAVRGEPAHFAVDVWAVGITALEIARLQVPYYGLPRTEVVRRILTDPPPTLQTANTVDENRSNWSADFNSFIARCFAPVDEVTLDASGGLQQNKPGTRRATARELLQDPFIRQWSPNGPIACPREFNYWVNYGRYQSKSSRGSYDRGHQRSNATINLMSFQELASSARLSLLRLEKDIENHASPLHSLRSSPSSFPKTPTTPAARAWTNASSAGANPHEFASPTVTLSPCKEGGTPEHSRRRNSLTSRLDKSRFDYQANSLSPSNLLDPARGSATSPNTPRQWLHIASPLSFTPYALGSASSPTTSRRDLLDVLPNASSLFPSALQSRSHARVEGQINRISLSAIMNELSHSPSPNGCISTATTTTSTTISTETVTTNSSPPMTARSSAADDGAATNSNTAVMHRPHATRIMAKGQGAFPLSPGSGAISSSSFHVVSVPEGDEKFADEGAGGSSAFTSVAERLTKNGGAAEENRAKRSKDEQTASITAMTEDDQCNEDAALEGVTISLVDMKLEEDLGNVAGETVDRASDTANNTLATTRTSTASFSVTGPSAIDDLPSTVADSSDSADKELDGPYKPSLVLSLQSPRGPNIITDSTSPSTADERAPSRSGESDSERAVFRHVIIEPPTEDLAVPSEHYKPKLRVLLRDSDELMDDTEGAIGTEEAGTGRPELPPTADEPPGPYRPSFPKLSQSIQCVDEVSIQSHWKQQ